MIRLLLAALVFACPAAAQPMADVTLLPGWRMQDGRHMAAVEIRLEPGWKTYWRAPGDAGIPPDFDWAGSRNLAEAEVHFPAPQAFTQSGMVSVGYRDGVVLPVALTPDRPGAPIDIRLALSLGVCAEICVPMEVDLSATLPPGDARPDRRIRTALALRPLSAAEASAGPATCEVTASERGARLTMRATVPVMGAGEFAAIEPSDPAIWVAQPQIRREGRDLVAETELAAPRGRPLQIDRDGLRLTVMGAQGAVEIVGCG